MTSDVRSDSSFTWASVSLKRVGQDIELDRVVELVDVNLIDFEPEGRLIFNRGTGDGVVVAVEDVGPGMRAICGAPPPHPDHRRQGSSDRTP